MESKEPYNINANSGYLLLHAAQRYRLGIAGILQAYELTPAQFFILMSIWYQSTHMTPPTQVQVAEYAATDINVTSQVIRKLIGRGIVMRSQKPDDSRAYALSLTTKGEALAQATGRLAERFHQVFFGSTDSQTLDAQLSQLIRNQKVIS